MGTGVAVAGLIIAAVGTGAGIHQGRKAERARKDADAGRLAEAELANQREIKKAIAQSRLQQAETEAAGQAQGAGDSSALTGALGSAQTQLASNIGFARQTQAANSLVGQATRRFNNATSNAAIAGQVAALPSAFGFSPADATRQLTDNSNKADKDTLLAFAKQTKSS